MKITAIKAQVKNDNRASVFIDGKYAFSLTLDQLLSEKLKKGDDIDVIRQKELKKKSDDGKLRARALEWLLNRPHATQEFKTYLYKKGAGRELIENLVVEFTEKNYLNDEKFAQWFAENRFRKQKSSRSISLELASKGISRETIQSVVKQLEPEGSEEESLIILVNKLRKKSRYQDDTKLIRYLLSKGFLYSDIKKVI